MTSRLYYTNAYLRSFDASVVAVDETGCRVYLDRTAFYPTSGGQPFDTGTISGAAVIDVVDEGDRIAHVLDRPLESSAGTVSAVVDWHRRFDHMQQHTGQHLLSAVLADMFGCATASVHFGAHSSSLDVTVETLSPDDVTAAELRANHVIAENRSVAVTFEDAEEASGLRKASDRSGSLRVVTIDGIDRSACGGTHVRATGEVACLLVRRTERVKRQTRLEFLCGLRAVRRARSEFDTLTRIARGLSAGFEDLPALIEAQGERLRAVDAEKRRLETELVQERAKALYDGAPTSDRGVRLVVRRSSAAEAEELRALAQAVARMPRAVFVASVDEPPTIVVGASSDMNIDVGKTLKAILTSVGGRGGGSALCAQGTAPTADALSSAVESFIAVIPS